MSSTIPRYLFTLLIVIVFVVGGLYVYWQHDRYALVLIRGENGNLISTYKIDKNTGRVWWILESTCDEVRDRSVSKSSVSPEEQAIGMAQAYHMPGSTSSMDEAIRTWLEGRKGPLKVYGWNSRKIEDQTYLVAYTYEQGGGGSSGWVFEVNLKASIVRNVNADGELEKKYGDWAQTLPTRKEGLKSSGQFDFQPDKLDSRPLPTGTKAINH